MGFRWGSMLRSQSIKAELGRLYLSINTNYKQRTNQNRKYNPYNLN